VKVEYLADRMTPVLKGGANILHWGVVTPVDASLEVSTVTNYGRLMVNYD
jgi:hypothetical protein